MSKVRFLLTSIAFLLLLALARGNAALAQSSSAVADLAARINRERLAHGLVPYALNPKLTAAAQAHAQDIASTGNYSHTGSDGSTVFERVARTGYGAYSWGRRLGENWAWYSDAATAMTQWMSDEPHRNNLLHPLYREIGVGIVPGAKGNTVFVVDFGAQPNVLPVFINDGASATRTQDITLTLSSEQVMPGGDGPGTIGAPVQVQISNTPAWDAAQWQAFNVHIPWVLPTGGGAKTVYLKYRDAKGRTATASASILLDLPTTPTPRPTRTATRTPQPTLTATLTVTPVDTPTFAATEVLVLEETPTLTATETLMPTETTLPPVTLAAQALELSAGPLADPILVLVLGMGILASILAMIRYFGNRS